jgi:hypothetical protein
MNKPLLILSTIAAITLASCDNENTTNPEPLGTVTITGAIVGDLDQDDEDNPTYEKVPAGVVVYFMDVSSGTNAVLGTTSTTADGYSIDLEIGAPKDIRIIVGDFETTVNVYDFVEDDYVKKTAVYNFRDSETIGDAVKGATYIQNIIIETPEPVDF